MAKLKRPVIGVIAAEANSIEQREILKGLVGRAQSLGYDTAVISNVFNPNIMEVSLFTENHIYELIRSEDISSFVLIAESFVNEELRKIVAGELKKRDVPVVVVGTYLEEFDLPGYTFINTSDEADMEEITDHLIEEHGFTDIDFITGYAEIEASQKRILGYKKALISHDIAVDESRIFYGTFWMDSGKDLAQRYISGELRLPQAIVCANDYMAYGILDEFAKNGISVPDQVTVVGYEYIRRRTLYSPLLTTYQRNREDLGKAAIELLHARLTGAPEDTFIPPAGTLVHGDSCPCGHDKDQFLAELDAEKNKRDFEFWNLFTPVDQELTQSQNLSEFIATLGKYHWHVRSVYNIFICLASNWYDTEAPMSNIVSCRTIMPWLDTTPKDIDKLDLAEILSMGEVPAVYYFTPLFFSDRMFGHVVLKYDIPDTYDDIFRNWIKSVSNALEFLRMKNDIQYLTKVQDLSEQRDTLTGMFNAAGMEKAYRSAVPHGDKQLSMIMLKVCLFDDSITNMDNSRRIEAIIDASRAVGQLCGNHDVCARISDTTFVALVQSNADEEVLSDSLVSILIQHHKYLQRYGMDSFVCVTARCDGSRYDELISKCSASADKKAKEMSDKRLISHYKEMIEIRNVVYEAPEDTFDTDALHSRFLGSTGYLRSVFKQCFGVSFHKDCIAARIAKAKYQLATTSMSIIEISEKCGYLDSKYFLRQFSSIAGMTPVQYRNLLQG
ncbi:MAG: substrate-binding domain-containing protein [Ruminococcus sp.]|nr:substrate-binding domain-containing protein [Ruminococcus sp.]